MHRIVSSAMLLNDKDFTSTEESESLASRCGRKNFSSTSLPSEREHCLLLLLIVALPALTVQDIVFQLQRFVSALSKYYDDCYAVLRDADVFPIEVDLTRTTLSYGQKDIFTDGAEDEEEEEGGGVREGTSKEEENTEKLIDDA